MRINSAAGDVGSYRVSPWIACKPTLRTESDIEVAFGAMVLRRVEALIVIF